MRKAAELRALVERADRVRTERAETHRRNIEDRCRIGLAAGFAADRDPKTGRIGDWNGARRMRDELIAIFVNVDEGTKGAVAYLILGPRIDKRALAPRKGRFLMIVLEKILPEARANVLEEPSQSADNRIVAAYRMQRLPQIVEPDA